MKRTVLFLVIICVCLVSSLKWTEQTGANTTPAKAESVLGHMETVGHELNSLVASL